jgi:hypothetical protein
MRPNKDLERRSDAIGSENALRRHKSAALKLTESIKKAHRAPAHIARLRLILRLGLGNNFLISNDML